MELLQFVQVALAITCCYAAFQNPFHPSILNPAIQQQSSYRRGTLHRNAWPFIARRQGQVVPPPMLKPHLNGIHYTKPKFLSHPKPFFKNIKPMKPRKPMKPSKRMKLMKPMKPLQSLKTMNSNKMKYMKSQKISMKPKIPFMYLRTKPKQKYRLPTFVVRRNYINTRIRYPGVGVYKRPRYQPPRGVYQRRPLARPPTRPSFQPPSTQIRPQPQYPVRSYNPHPMPRQQPAYETPRDQPPTFNEFPQYEPDTAVNTPQGLPPPVNNIPQIEPIIPDNIPFNQQSSGQAFRPQSQLPVQTYTSQPIQPFISPSKGEYVQPKVITEQRRKHWLQTASGKADNFAVDSDDEDDFEDKWEKQFEDFDEGLEDVLAKKKDGYYDNDDDDMLDDKIFENFEKMRRLRRNMARNRNYLEDLNKVNGKDREKYFEKSASGSMQQTQRFQSGSLSMQPTKSLEERFEKQNKYQENFFEKVGTQITLRPRQQGVDMPSRSNDGKEDFSRGQVIYDEKYFDKMKPQAGRQNSDLQSRHGNNKIPSRESKFGKSLSRRNNFDKEYFDRKGDPLSQQNFQYQESINPGQDNRLRGSFDSRRNINDRKYLDRNQELNGSFQTARPFMGSQGGRINDNKEYFGNKRDFAERRAIGFKGSDQTIGLVNEIGSKRNDLRNNDNKYFERKVDGLTQSSDVVRTSNTKDFNQKEFFGEKYIEQELNRRRIQQQNLRASMPEVFNTVESRQSKNANEQKYFEIAENQKKSNQMHRADTRVYGNGLEHRTNTLQRVNFADNTDSVKREQFIKHRNDNTKFLEKKDEFRTFIRHLTEMQNNNDSQRELRISQRNSFSIPKA